MPKKDTATAVLGMLSTAGAQTRPTNSAEIPTPTLRTFAAQAPSHTEPVADTRPSATVSTLPPTPPQVQAREDLPAPRTIRLRADTARELRAAWLVAKRDDVLLQSQDFASTLVEEALASRRRRARAADSS